VKFPFEKRSENSVVNTFSRSLFATLATGLGLLFSSPSHAFPTMVSHGYTTCLTCHHSPSGGGMLTNYGKFIAGELLGTFNDSSTALPWLRNPDYEQGFEAKFFAAKPELLLGAQGRVVQTEFESEEIKRGDFRLMQLDLETGVSFGKFYGVVQAGVRGASATSEQREHDLNVRQWYVGARDITYAFRVGRFFPEFGIRHPNHNLPTRKGMFFNHNEEPDLAQLSLFFTNVDFTLGFLKGAEKTGLANKSGTTGTVTVRTAHTRTGISHLYARESGAAVEGFSAFTAIGFLEKGHVLAESGFKQLMPEKRNVERTVLGFVEAGWEFYHGITLYSGYQHTYVEKSASLARSIPVGLRMFPITHFQLDLEASRQFFDIGGKASTGHSLFAMLHFYF
jgi:hypothetical protein